MANSQWPKYKIMRRLLTLFIALFSCVVAWAQSAVVSGRFFDVESTEGVVGAIVEISMPRDSLYRRHYTTGYGGFFKTPPLPRGEYKLTATFLGYQDYERTFKVDAKRADKRFPLKSPEIAALAGGAILESMNGRIGVSMDHPEATVTVEIREEHAYVHADAVKGAGGMPIGTAGKAMLLLSGGIDSPVAGYMMAKRGAKIEAVHFESFPYTSDAAKEKVLELARLISNYCGTVRVTSISVTEIQEKLRDTVKEEYFTLLLRRVMMRLAARVARERGCDALVTGESLGQVASQTMLAMGVTDPAADMLVFRPCIGMDKEEIIEIARKIDTFETSILPYEDCCTVFTPKHPKTRPELPKVIAEEELAALTELEDEAFAKKEVYYKSYYED